MDLNLTFWRGVLIAIIAMWASWGYNLNRAEAEIDALRVELSTCSR